MPTAPPAEPLPPTLLSSQPTVAYTVATDPVLALRTMRRMMRMTQMPQDQIDQVVETGCDLLGVDREAVA